MKIAKNLFLIFLFFLTLMPILFLIFSIFFPNFYFDFENFLKILQIFNEKNIIIFSKSVMIAALTAVTATSIGLTLAILLEFTNISYKNFFRFIFFVPFLIPTYLFTFSWLGFLGKRGTFTEIIFPNLPINIYNPVSLIAFLTLSFFPISMFIISLGLKNIDRNLIDVARLTSKKFLLKILIPLIKPHIIISFFFIFSFSISEYVTPSFLRINTYQAELFTQLAAFFNLERAMLYSFPLILLTSLFSFSIYLYFKNISISTITSFFRKKEEFIILSKKSKIFIYTYFLILISLSLIIPSVIMIIEAKNEFLGFLTVKTQLFNSLILSYVSASIITILGVLTYYFFRKNILLLTFFILPLGISSPIIGIALINFYSKIPLPIYGTSLMIILGFISRFLPFSIFISSSFLPQISFSLEEYSKICKASFFKKMRKIVLPLSKGAVLSSFAIIFILCLGEVGITQMVSPPGFQTLSMRIETLMHYGNYSIVASLSLTLLLFIFIFYLIYVKMYERIY